MCEFIVVVLTIVCIVIILAIWRLKKMIISANKDIEGLKITADKLNGRVKDLTAEISRSRRY